MKLITFKIVMGGQHFEVKGQLIDTPHIKCAVIKLTQKFYMHCIIGTKPYFAVYEVTTGKSINTSGKTKKDVVDSAIYFLSTKTADECKEAISNFEVINK